MTETRLWDTCDRQLSVQGSNLRKVRVILNDHLLFLVKPPAHRLEVYDVGMFEIRGGGSILGG